MEAVLEKKRIVAGNITRALLREEMHALLDEAGLRSSVPTNVPEPAQQSTCHYHLWGGKFHVLPQDFQFPSIDPLGAWLLWWFGNQQLKYPPTAEFRLTILIRHKRKQHCPNGQL
jgi:hypothetical protein